MRDWAMITAEERIRAQLLHSISEVACTLANGRAASVALLDEDSGDLVFVAAAGETADEVEGARFPCTTGVAGHVLRTGEPVLIHDVSAEPRFAHDIAVATGYEPDAMAVVPVQRAGRTIGVIEVLDPSPDAAVLGPLAILAAHAAVTLDLSAALVAGGAAP
jgi:GAF domain-containing protein